MKILLSICLLLISFLLSSCINEQKENFIENVEQKIESIETKEVFIETSTWGWKWTPISTGGIR